MRRFVCLAIDADPRLQAAAAARAGILIDNQANFTRLIEARSRVSTGGSRRTGPNGKDPIDPKGPRYLARPAMCFRGARRRRRAERAGHTEACVDVARLAGSSRRP